MITREEIIKECEKQQFLGLKRLQGYFLIKGYSVSQGIDGVSYQPFVQIDEHRFNLNVICDVCPDLRYDNDSPKN
ncbi:MAG TPA: hypothetical protein VEP90_05145 [Methylomirabilota bacterium]|nr:hypothetical protein [Methylomirabilota bacterium]